MEVKMKVYLAHSFANRFKVRDEIIPLLQEMFPHWIIENPFLREGRENQAIFEYDGNSEKELATQRTKAGYDIDQRDKEIVEKDIIQLEECDALVCYVENLSIGAPCEIFYNSYILKKPTVLVYPTRSDLYYHPWLNYLSTEKIVLDEVNG